MDEEIKSALSTITPEGWKALHAVAQVHKKANPAESDRLFNPFTKWLYENYVRSLENIVSTTKGEQHET